MCIHRRAGDIFSQRTQNILFLSRVNFYTVNSGKISKAFLISRSIEDTYTEKETTTDMTRVKSNNNWKDQKYSKYI